MSDRTAEIVGTILLATGAFLPMGALLLQLAFNLTGVSP